MPAATVVMAITLVSATTEKAIVTSARIRDNFLRVWHLIVDSRALVSKISSVIIGMIKVCFLYLAILILLLLVRFLFFNCLSVFFGLHRLYFFSLGIACSGLLGLGTDDKGICRADFLYVVIVCPDLLGLELGTDDIGIYAFC